MIKIHGKGEKTLCRTCDKSQIIDDGSETIRIYCRALEGSEGPPLLNFVVHECSSYVDATQTSLYDMKKIAWILDPNKKQQIGFHKPGTEEWAALVKPSKYTNDYTIPGVDE